MTKYNLRKYLQKFSKIRKALQERKSSLKIQIYGQTKEFYFENWAYWLPAYIEEILENEQNTLFIEMVKLRYYMGKSDRAVLARLPLSESTYYRWKNHFIDKLYELFIQKGFVSREEILQYQIAL